jgi:hypothetical protein
VRGGFLGPERAADVLDAADLELLLAVRLVTPRMHAAVGDSGSSAAPDGAPRGARRLWRCLGAACGGGGAAAASAVRCGGGRAAVAMAAASTARSSSAPCSRRRRGRAGRVALRGSVWEAVCRRDAPAHGRSRA